MVPFCHVYSITFFQATLSPPRLVTIQPIVPFCPIGADVLYGSMTKETPWQAEGNYRIQVDEKKSSATRIERQVYFQKL